MADASGASHYLGETFKTTTVGNDCPPLIGQVDAIDGSGIGYNTGGLRDSSGNIAGVQDPNGNVIALNGSFVTSGCAPSMGTNGWTDSIGRNIPPPPPSPPNPCGRDIGGTASPGCLTVNYPGQSGGT